MVIFRGGVTSVTAASRCVATSGSNARLIRLYARRRAAFELSRVFEPGTNGSHIGHIA
ncbi:MAG: hypothetical protein RMM98_14630 [Acidobacteriota bacterium]|nr:hypothetical protein [Acidobacteriota bacterium]